MTPIHPITRYSQVRALSEALCAPLLPEDYVVQPIVDVSPPKWHLGHTTWFFENFILAPHIPGYQLFNPSLNWFFNSYYESQGPRILRSHRGNMTRPSVAEVLDYRRHVDGQLARAWESASWKEELSMLLEVGLQHEQQHQELLVTDLKYILGNNPLFPSYASHPLPPAEAGDGHFVRFEAGLYQIGYSGSGFAWDNEQPAHPVWLQPFEIQNRLVTNGEYLAFMEAGGYADPQHWLSDGWAWVKTLETPAPLYWYERDGQWWHYTLHGLAPVDPHLPLTHISYYEADAFASWNGARLPTEAEWEVAARQLEPSPASASGFLEGGFFHPPADKGPQFLGSVWEWTQSAYLPYPGFQKWAGALGEYNGKFMINQMVLRGGSCATPLSHFRHSYRNFFQPDKRWQFTGIRLARSIMESL